MRRAGDMLVRVLAERGPCRLMTADERPWGSVTFVGAQHALWLVIPEDAAEGFLAGIEEAAFDLGEHLLADIAVVANAPLGGMRMVPIEALTIERADLFPPRRAHEKGRDEGTIGTTCGTKRAFVPLAAA